jgi:hypothetical protein
MMSCVESFLDVGWLWLMASSLLCDWVHYFLLQPQLGQTLEHSVPGFFLQRRVM